MELQPLLLEDLKPKLCSQLEQQCLQEKMQQLWNHLCSSEENYSNLDYKSRTPYCLQIQMKGDLHLLLPVSFKALFATSSAEAIHCDQPPWTKGLLQSVIHLAAQKS